MKSVKCINKFKDNQGRVYLYRLMDSNAEMTDITPHALKSEIEKNETYVINLTLDEILSEAIVEGKTSEAEEETREKEEPIGTKPSVTGYIDLTTDIIEYIDFTQNLKFKSNQDINILKQKAILLGYSVNEISRSLISLETDKDILLVSDKQIRLKSDYLKPLFKNTNFLSIDFHDTDISNITDMSEMFCGCQANFLDLSTFDTSDVTDMSGMFAWCKVQSLDISNFNTSKVTNMSQMFCCCAPQSLDLSTFNTSNVEDMYAMFAWCKAQSLDLSSFNTSKVKNMGQIFDGCEAKVKATDTKILNKCKGKGRH